MIIFIRGLPRSGKTTISNTLAEKLKWKVIHVDDFKKELMDQNPKAFFIQEVVPYSYKKTLEELEKNKGSDLIVDELFRNKDFVQEALNFCNKNNISYRWFNIERDMDKLVEANENRLGKVKPTPEILKRMKEEIDGATIEGEVKIYNGNIKECVQEIFDLLKI